MIENEGTMIKGHFKNEKESVDFCAAAITFCVKESCLQF